MQCHISEVDNNDVVFLGVYNKPKLFFFVHDIWRKLFLLIWIDRKLTNLYQINLLVLLATLNLKLFYWLLIYFILVIDITISFNVTWQISWSRLVHIGKCSQVHFIWIDFWNVQLQDLFGINFDGLYSLVSALFCWLKDINLICVIYEKNEAIFWHLKVSDIILSIENDLGIVCIQWYAKQLMLVIQVNVLKILTFIKHPAFITLLVKLLRR